MEVMELNDPPTSRRYRVTNISPYNVEVLDKIDGETYVYSVQEFIEYIRYFNAGRILGTGMDADTAQLKLMFDRQNEARLENGERSVGVHSLCSELNMVCMKQLYDIENVHIYDSSNGLIYAGKGTHYIMLYGNMKHIEIHSTEYMGSVVIFDINCNVDGFYMSGWSENVRINIDLLTDDRKNLAGRWNFGRVLHIHSLFVHEDCMMSACEWNSIARWFQPMSAFSLALSIIDTDYIDLSIVAKTVSDISIILLDKACEQAENNGIRFAIADDIADNMTYKKEYDRVIITYLSDGMHRKRDRHISTIRK